MSDHKAIRDAAEEGPYYTAMVAKDDLRALLSDLDAMRADAQRYRWLRNEAVQFGFDDGRLSAWAVVGTHYAACNPIQGDELDAAIDAALKGAAHE